MRQFMMMVTALAVFGAMVVTAQAENSPPTASGPVTRPNIYDRCSLPYREPQSPEVCDRIPAWWRTSGGPSRVGCHCNLECREKYEYYVRVHVFNRTPPFCYQRRSWVGTTAQVQCQINCMAAKGYPPPEWLCSAVPGLAATPACWRARSKLK
jgi:hypothetical protein